MGLSLAVTGWESRQLQNSFQLHTAMPLVASESRGLESESLPATCPGEGPAVPGRRGSMASGQGVVLAWQDCGLWAPVVEMLCTRFPVFTEQRVGPSLWLRKWPGEGLATGVWREQ